MYEDVKEQFSKVIQFSQGIAEPKLDSLFSEWAAAKEKFIDRFGGLIYEWPEQIEFTLDEKMKHDRAMEFANVVHDNFNNPDLAQFIDENIDGFFENKIINTRNNTIPSGMKLIKAFKFFEKDKVKLRALQDYASSYIQENKIKGTLCFSVHPLDFLSSSENTYNWRSCHSLDGDFRSGNLSYMVDEATFMVYLKGADNVRLSAFPDSIKWNSKKWRMLIHTSKDDKLMFAGRQYPFSSKIGIDIVLDIYNNLIGTEFVGYRRKKYGEWKSDYVDSYVPVNSDPTSPPIELDSKYIIFYNQLFDINNVVLEGDTALNYNDVLKSSCYKYPYYAILNPFDWYNTDNILKNPILVGGSVKCLHCENEIITTSETMRCYQCELKYGTEENDNFGYCACCGARIIVENAAIVGKDEELVCQNCLENECFVCDGCGEIYFKTDKHYVKSPITGAPFWFCQDCYDEFIEEYDVEEEEEE